jgi:tetratricopeptide (TPR) repeat protein
VPPAGDAAREADQDPIVAPIADAVAALPAQAVSAAGEDPDAPALKRAAGARVRGLLPFARDILGEIVKRRPGWVPARRELILLHLAAEEFAEAERHLLLETKRSPRERWCWMSLGLVRSRTGDKKGEIECLRKAVELKFESAAARRLFDLQREVQDFAGALETVALLRRTEDTNLLAGTHCQLLVRLGRPNEALALCEQLMERKPAPVGAVEQWARIFLNERNDPETVIATLGKHIEAGRREGVFYLGLSRGLHRVQRHREAIEALHRALEIEPKHAYWWYELAVLQRQMGDIPGSQVSLERSITLEPANPMVLRIFGAEHKHAYGDEAMRRINLALAGIEHLRPERKVELHFAAAKAAEDVGETACAFAHYRNGGRLQTKLTPYRHAKAEALLKLTRLNMTRAAYDRARDQGCPSDKPVFVLGMPRSGTTLAEQIIASHPEAHGAGELKVLQRVVDGISVNGKAVRAGNEEGEVQTYIPGVDLSCKLLNQRERGERYVQAIEALARTAGRPEARRIVDKMPGNYAWCGVIPFILPRARIVHTRRHPVDTCLSLYRIFFPDGMPWSYDLRNLGKVYRAYHEHMQFWEKTLPEGMILSLRYEDVVADVERQARRIIAHIGLEWNEACLKFYETERPVRTASLSQVRQPIYSTSVGRWRKYEAYLKPLLAELGPLLRAYEDELAGIPAP